MGILSPTYDAELHFSDLVDVISHNWNPTMFDLNKLSDLQLETHMINGTFEKVWPKILMAYYEETHTRPENIAYTIFYAIAPYLKQDTDTKRPRHIYIPNISPTTQFGNTSTFLFTIWDDYQREYAFEMLFSFKNV